MTESSPLQQSNVPRHNEILKLLDLKGHLTVGEMTTTLGVSEQTIRRDLQKLEKMHLLSRFHGGASRLTVQRGPNSQGFVVNKEIEIREVTMIPEKEAIANKVAELVPDGSCVFITIGTTVEKIAAALNQRNGLFVITNSLRVAAILYRSGRNKVLVPSGIISSNNGGIGGPQTNAELKYFRPDFTITSVGAIAHDGTLLDYNIGEVEAARVMMQNAQNTIIACDHTKFTATASVRLGAIEDADYFVTDIEPDESIRHRLENGGVTLICAN